jgi:PleD family two-component response regulator
MTSAPKILLVDDDPGDRMRLATALREKFPTAELDECGDTDAAVVMAEATRFTVVITHRVKDTGALPLVCQFREANQYTPLILVSDIHRRESARAAGANELLPCGEWQQIGALVEHVLAAELREPMRRQYA